VYKGLRSGVQDVAVKVLTISGELEMRQFWVEISLLKSLSYDRNIVQVHPPARMVPPPPIPAAAVASSCGKVSCIFPLFFPTLAG